MHDVLGNRDGGGDLVILEKEIRHGEQAFRRQVGGGLVEEIGRQIEVQNLIVKALSLGAAKDRDLEELLK